jgi:hypothetical protein
MKSNSVFIILSSLAMAVLCPTSALGCAACYGQSDSSLAVGMNWGILSLLAVVLCVLGGIAAFFIYLAKRSAMTEETGLSEPVAETTKH